MLEMLVHSCVAKPRSSRLVSRWPKIEFNKAECIVTYFSGKRLKLELKERAGNVRRDGRTPVVYPAFTCDKCHLWELRWCFGPLSGPGTTDSAEHLVTNIKATACTSLPDRQARLTRHLNPVCPERFLPYPEVYQVLLALYHISSFSERILLLGILIVWDAILPVWIFTDDSDTRANLDGIFTPPR